MTNNTISVFAFSWGFGPIRWAYSHEAAEHDRQEAIIYSKKWGWDPGAVSPVYQLPLSMVGEGWDAEYISL